MVTLRVRSVMWFSVGLVLALAMLWTSLVWRAEALPTSDESTIVNVPPARVLDSRNPTDLGLPGPFVSAVSQKLKVTGVVATPNGMATVVPDGATGVVMTVTTVGPTAGGFISIRPGDAIGAPTTSSLNFGAGETVANTVQVSLPTSGPNAGQIDIVYDALGVAGPTTDILIDVVGYTKSSGVADLVTQLAAKPNAADVYTKVQSDANYVPQGKIVMSHSTYGIISNSAAPAAVEYLSSGTRAEAGGIVGLGLVGPARLGAVDYGLESVEFCIEELVQAFVTNVTVVAENGAAFVSDDSNRLAAGCYSVTVNATDGQAYDISWSVGALGGGTNRLRFSGVKSTWAPVSTIPAPRAVESGEASAPSGD